MTIPTQYAGYGIGVGTKPNASNVPVIQTRAPASTDYNYSQGTIWVDKTNNNSYQLTSFSTSAGVTSANWQVLGGATADVNTLSGDTGTASPTAGNIQIVGGSGIVTSATGSTVTIDLEGGGVAIDSFVPDTGTSPVVPTALGAVTMAGTANQITTTGGTNALTFSIPSAFIAPGSVVATTTIASTTTMTAGTGLTVTTGNLAISSGNANVTGNVVASKSSSGANVTVQATNSDNTSGTSNAGVEIASGGSSGGDPYLSFQISGVGASTMTMGLDNSSSDTFVISNSASIGTSNALTLTQAGALGATTSITAGTTLTATSGDITASNGNFVGSTSGTGILLNSPAASGAAASPVVVNGRSGQATFTSVSIAAAADLTLTITNSAITGASTQVLYSMSGSTTGSAPSIKSVTNSSGSSAIVVTNGTGATTTTADIVLTFLVLN